MQLHYTTLVILLLYSILIQVDSFGFVYPFIAVGFSASYAGYEFIKGYVFESCNPVNEKREGRVWIRNSDDAFQLLQQNLTNQVYGQPLARSVISKALKAHLRDDNPVKALVMSFHGWSGSGKNHVSRIIAGSIYRMGTKSSFVKQIFGSHYQNSDNLTEYKVINLILLFLF